MSNSSTSRRKQRRIPEPVEQPTEDVFAKIGQGASAAREKLFEPQPAVLADKDLPVGAYRSAHDFKAPRAMRSVEAFRRELTRLRQAAVPYLGHHAPALPLNRWSQTIPEARWRITADRNGQPVKNRWTTVSLPHYGAPTGRATTHYEWTVTLADTPKADERIYLCFKGADYRAQVYCNGVFLCAHEGFFEPFEADISSVVKVGRNHFHVQLDNDAVAGGSLHDGDGEKIYAATGLGWDEPGAGWHHCPPGMGLYQTVYLEKRPALYLADVWVRPLPKSDSIEINVTVRNGDRQPTPLPVSLLISVFGGNFKATPIKDLKPDIAQKAGPGHNLYRFTVPLPSFRWWTPDAPWLYEAQVQLLDAEGTTRDAIRTTFGMRTFEISETSPEKGQLFLNGEEVRLRGANTMGHEQQCVLHGDLDQLRDDILIAKLGGLNFLRITQRPVQKEIYEACDALGMMVQTDLPLFGKVARTQFSECVRQAAAMERLIRPHPSCILSSYINEPFPISWGDTTHRHLTRIELEAMFVAATAATHVENPDRQIKAVDGDYDPPGPGLPDNHCYSAWYCGHAIDLGKLHRGYWVPVKKGWRYACGEFGAEGLESADLMRRRYPKTWLPSQEGETWTPNKIHLAQTGPMHGLWMDSDTTMDGWIAKSQQHQTWATRIMTRAFRRDRRMVSFAIHLLIDAFPAGWMKTLVDCERNPKPAFFEYRDALQPLLVDFRIDRWSWRSGETFQGEAWICNDRNQAPKGVRLRYVIETAQGPFASGTADASVPINDVTFQGHIRCKLPIVSQRTQASLRLALVDIKGRVLNETCEKFALFPSQAPITTPTSICLPDRKQPRARRLLKDLGLTAAVRAPRVGDLIISSNAEHLESALEVVRQGATLILLELPEGKYPIESETLTIEAAGFNPRHFVSRATGHPLVSGFEAQDFRLWHDPAQDAVSPLLDNLILAEGWTPILLTSQCGWGRPTQPAYACAEKTLGQGRVIICQIKLAGRTSTNPTAESFARRLLQPDN